LTKLIGLHGKMHSGKSTIADFITTHNTYDTAVLSFAGKLRETLSILNIREQRESMQQLGQGLRDIWPDVWVDAVRKDVDNYIDSNCWVVFDDLRYPNEFEYIKDNGGFLIRLEADSDVRWNRYQTSTKYNANLTRAAWDTQQNHESEKVLDDCSLDWALDVNTNNFSKEDMEWIASAVLSEHITHPRQLKTAFEIFKSNLDWKYT
tara:strand:+ start:129 stop:746 length:618 start_codon:yes stop_codon:yes gene_type:complete